MSCNYRARSVCQLLNLLQTTSRVPQKPCTAHHRRYSSSAKQPVFRQLSAPVDQSSDSFKENIKFSEQYVAQYEKIMAVAKGGGGQKAMDRHVQRNKKLLVEDRLKLLFDNSDDMLEIAPLAGMGMKYGDIPRAGILAAIGKIHGIQCLVIANDATVKAGTIYPISVKKQLRCQEIAQKNRLPCVFIVDSGGAFLPLQDEIFLPGGRTFHNEAVLNSLNIPQLAVVCGSCTAGAAYVPTMAQEAVIVERIGTIFLGGPPLVQAALGEVVSPDELGGAKLHSSVSGCTDFYAESEQEAFALSRDVVATYNMVLSPEPAGYQEPVYDSEEMLGLVPARDQHTMDMYQIIARIVDGSRFHEFKAIYGTTLICGFAHIQGRLVGLLGNHGLLAEQASQKGAHFVQLCSQRNVPIIFLQNSSPSTPADVSEGSLLRAHAKLMGAVACASVPKITVIVGNSYGPDNFMMCGRSFDPSFVFSWPNAKTCIMEPDELVKAVTKEHISGLSEEERSAVESGVRERVSGQTSALYSSANLWDDGVILPHHTRQVLGQSLSVVSQQSSVTEASYNVMRM